MFTGPPPPTRHERWKLCQQIIRDWFPMKTSSDEPALIEPTIEQQLPTALCEFHSHFGDRNDVWSVQDHLLPLEELRLDNARLVFMRENQGVVEWYFKESDLGLADPPVYVDDVDGGTPHREAESFSLFSLHMLALAAKFSDRPLFQASGVPVADHLDLGTDLSTLTINPLHWPVWPTHFYGNADILVELDSDICVWLTARSDAAFSLAKLACEDSGVEWE